MIPQSIRIEEQGNIRFRILLVFIFTLFLFTAIIVRLFQKQVLQFEHYKALAYSQRYREEKILPARGEIFITDIYSDELYPLVTNKTFWAVMVIPNQVTDKERLASSLGPIIDMNPTKIIQLLEENKLYIPPLRHKLDDEKRKAIEALNLDGVMLIPESYRDYPEGNMGAKFLGFVDNNGDGQYGIEGHLNDILKGRYGKLIAEKDILGRQITVADNKIIPPKNGKDVVLTIDRVIQFMAEEEIKGAVEQHQADSGSVVIMDPRTGGILALAEYPSYDPANYTEVSSDDYEIFKCMAASDAYESGSVFKAIAMAAGIDSGVVSPDTGEFFEANVVVDDYTIWNSERKPYGYETMTQVLENSDNVGMVWMMDKLGKDKFYEYLNRFRFGRITGVEIEGESPGIVKDKKYLPHVGLATMSFGQGINVTEMQLVQAMAAIANGGLMVKPTLVKYYIDKNGRKEKKEPDIIGRVLDEEAAMDIIGMLINVVEKGHGRQAKLKGYRIGGKTGTAQIPLKDRRGYEEDKFVGSFLGFGPADNPLFVMIVRINVPRDVVWAESTAAPVFGRLAKKILDYYQIPPDDEWAREQEKIEEELKKERMRKAMGE